MKNTFQNLICELIALYLVAIFGCGIYIIDAQNKTKKVFSGLFDGPAISPDGNQITFVQMKWDTASNEFFETGGMVKIYNVLISELKIIYEWSVGRHINWAGHNELSVC